MQRTNAKEYLIRYLVAVLAVAGGLALRLLLTNSLGTTSPYITFFPAVMLAAWFGGFGPGLLATFLSLLAVFYFAVAPLYTLRIVTIPDAIGGLLFLAVAIFVSALTQALRSSRFRGEERFRLLKSAEVELRETNENLKRANRELEEFAYVASHDLQEPLRMVSLYSQLIVRRLGDQDSQINQYTGFIQQGVNRMQELIRDLLEYSRVGHAAEKTTATADLAQSFGEAVTLLRGAIEESGAVIHPCTLPQVRGETSQLIQVFQNLISNAIKYRKREGPLEIHISAEPVGEQWTISVRDNGIGFDPKYKERIFELFRRLHNTEYPGTGVGLAICQRIVERYGGRMWAESKPGEGSAFYFSLPGANV